MGISTMRGLLTAGCLALFLAGCASNEPEEMPDVQPADDAPVVAPKPMEPKAPPKPMVNSSGKMVIPKGSAYADSNAMMDEVLQGVFYFDFDQAIVKRAGHTELNKHARVLGGDRMLRVRLEGHADERGTREYNLALGERRANAIRAYLVAQGVAASRVEVISYGEEKPASPGHSESAWAMNRRVEVVYR